MLFKDWRLLSTETVPLPFVKGRIYYLHARAWALKGYLGGTHSWSTFWSPEHNKWLVVELTDEETISYQNAKILFTRSTSTDKTEHSPIISTREPNQRWFGCEPYIVDSSLQNFTYDDIVKACREYPIDEFIMIKRNCNTFSSYLNWKLGLNLKRPFRSVGYRPAAWWTKF